MGLSERGEVLGSCDYKSIFHAQHSGCKNWRPSDETPTTPAAAVAEGPGSKFHMVAVTDEQKARYAKQTAELDLERPVASQLTRIEKDLEALVKTMQALWLAHRTAIEGLEMQVHLMRDQVEEVRGMLDTASKERGENDEAKR